MAIVKWKFNDTMPDTLQGSYDNHINFTCNGVSYTSISTMGKPNGIYYGETQAYSWTTNKWNDIKYQYIEVDDTSTDYASFVEWAKENGGVLLEAGEYKWVEMPTNFESIGGTPEEPTIGTAGFIIFSFTSNSLEWNALAVTYGTTSANDIATYAAPITTEFYNANHGGWFEEAYRTIVTTKDQYIDYDFYQYAITGNQLIKQASDKVTIDLTTLQGWNDVTGGTHTLQVVAKAEGYKDSEKSTAISFIK